ncbi:zinc finger protein 652 [Folsomia candida]|uniref:zinc finger protein 652 n=1 Tax=Folsomia candida TaxID=158441 RepID=UPI000B900A4C|nr:zinc finger protein 652 [Folsomia candida]
MAFLSGEKALIDPAEIKTEKEEEFENGYTTMNVDLPGLLKELEFLEDTFRKAEIKLGTIINKWQNYFEDDISCNVNLMQDWLRSIKSCLDEITQKYRVDFAAAPSEYFQNLELPLKFEIKTGDDDSDGGTDKSREDVRRERKTRRKSRNQELTFAPHHETDSGDDQPSLGHISDPEDTDWTPPPQDDSPQPTKKPNRSKKQKTNIPKNPETDETSSPLEKQKRYRRSKFGPPPPPTSECPICRKVFSRLGMKSHIKRRHEPQGLKFPCSQCPSRFHSKSSLKTHSVTHSDSKSFICQICGWAFHQHTNLISHMKTHSEERPLKCDQCEATFKFSQSLKLHTEAMHSSVKQQCFSCGKMFSTVMKLKRHERQVHQSVRNHPCPRCDKSFKRIAHLRYHVKTHDNPNTKNRGLNKTKE